MRIRRGNRRRLETGYAEPIRDLPAADDYEAAYRCGQGTRAVRGIRRIIELRIPLKLNAEIR